MDEYIKREDAEKCAEKIINHPIEDGFRDSIEILNAIHNLPAADVRLVVRGRWKRVDPRSTVVTFRCSECNYYAHVNATNFCPNCGADMGETKT